MLATGVALALTLTAGGLWLTRHKINESPASAHASIRSIAVLPLANFSGHPEQDYLSDGMTEALIGRLSEIQGLRVISRTSVMQFKGTRESVPAIARELNVDAVIEGSVLRSGDKIHVSLRLIRARSEERVWSSEYDRELRDVLALQSEVAGGIARSIEVAAADERTASSGAQRTVAPEAYDTYLKGHFALHKQSRAGLEEALHFFQASIKADDTFAPAYVGVAEVDNELGTVYFGSPPGDSRPKVIAAARKALELDPDLAEARVLLANAQQKDWQWAEAETEYRRAIELSPSDANARSGLADWLECQGRTEEALLSARRAEELDPLAFHGIEVGWILFLSRRYDESIQELQSALRIEPENPMAFWYLGFALDGARRYDEAIPTLEKAASLSNQSSAVLGVLVAAYAMGGHRAEALHILDELQRRRQIGYVPSGAFLNAYLGLGDKEESFRWLERAAEERSNILQFLKVHPCFDLLRDDPRFAGYLRRTHLSS
ncbi:MAG TPA: tetratricopeptide repeat protein [Candidatus Solibacter sp.]|nr:tetratricopeptide repeat protein [Candidatus Solibacter sp.]